MKRLISTFLAASCIATCSLPLNAAMLIAEKPVADVTAAASTGKAVSNEPTTQEKVRPLIDVPEEYEDFNWHYSAGSYYSLPAWELSWTDGETGSISVRCDNRGRILNYENYLYKTDRTSSLPKYGPEAFVKTATDFIERTLPYTKEIDLRLTETATSSLYNHTYSYNFGRYENGILVPDNNISVTVNHETGVVTYLNARFTHGIEFKAPEGIISEEEAKEILAENQKMILSYRLLTEYDEETWEVKSKKAYLVYTPEKSYVSVDAFTGKVYNERNTWSVNEKGSAGGSVGNLNGALNDSVAKEEASLDREYQLTEKELEQLEILEQLITKEEAIAIITQNADLYIDRKATAITARLSKDTRAVPVKAGSDGETEDGYVWRIDFHSPSNEEKYHYSNMNAVIDATDGTIISFNCDIPGYYYYSQNQLPYPELKFTEDEAAKIADNFIKKHQAQKHENIRLSDSWNHTAIKYIELDNGDSTPVYGCKTFRFVRVNEGVDFTYNSFSVAVDLVSGKVTSYNFNWDDDVEFESPKNVISPDEALMSLYSYDGFGLTYEINSDYTYNKYLLDAGEGKYIDYDALYTSETYSRAVYSAYALGTTVIRAADGKMIDYSGEEYQERGMHVYSDIEGHWAEDTILRFTYAGIGFEGEEFKPDENITSDELYELLTNSRLYNYSEDFMLEEGTVTRADAVKYIIYALGYGKVASLENVFISDFADGTVLKSHDVGHIAIARAFGIIEGDGNSFRPYDYLTRAEAVTIIENVIEKQLLI